MTRRKTSITVDDQKATAALAIVGGDNFSHVVDVAFDALIAQHRMRQDVDAYQRLPPAPGLGRTVAVGTGDDVDWEALYGEPDR